MTAVVGIDSSSFGFHMVSSVPLWGHGSEFFFRSSLADARDRRAEVFPMAHKVFRALPAGTDVWLEEALVLPKNIETTRKLIMMTGVLEAAFWSARPDATWWSVDVATWRKAILGKGSGRKEEMKALARAYMLPLLTSTQEEEYEAEPDLYDAGCICAYGVSVRNTKRAA